MQGNGQGIKIVYAKDNAMIEGLLWFDDNKNRTLAQKVKDAAERHLEKFEQPATVCRLNATDANGDTAIGSIRLVVSPNVLPHHFLVGVDNG